MDDEAQAFIDAHKRPDGVMDWYKVLDVPRSASQEQIRDSFAILSATSGPSPEGRSKEDTVRYVLLKRAFGELNDPVRRKKYEAYLRHGQRARQTVGRNRERAPKAKDDAGHYKFSRRRRRGSESQVE